MNHTCSHRQRGLTLIELMIAMVIGLVLMGGVVQIFTGSKVSYLTQEELGRIQENARYALEVLTKDIRMAGYMGCMGQTNINDIVQPGLKPIGGTDFFTDPVLGFDAQSNSGTGLSDWSPTLPTYFSAGQSVAGSDVIVTQRAGVIDASLVGNTFPSNANIQLDSNPDNWIQVGDVLFLTDCVDSEVFMTTNVGTGSPVTIAHSSAVNTQPMLSKAYAGNSQLMKLIMNGYYVGTNADGNRSLFRSRLGQNGVMVVEELVEGVETLQIAYGEDLTGDGLPNRYVTANDVTTPGNIVAVRVGLLMYTVKQVATENDNRSFSLAGTAVAATATTPTHGGDKSLRQAYSATVKIRNRGMQ